MKCVYCYNPEIVYGKGKISIAEVLSFLNKRRNLLDGVVLSGGECTSHKSVVALATEIKRLGFLIKVDTNGSNPEVIKELIDRSLIDYIALDYKAPESKFNGITQSNHYASFEQTLNYLLSINFPFEIRSTFHSELLRQEDIHVMLEVIQSKGYKKAFYIQKFLNGTDTIVDLPESNNASLDLSVFSTGIELVERNI